MIRLQTDVDLELRCDEEGRVAQQALLQECLRGIGPSPAPSQPEKGGGDHRQQHERTHQRHRDRGAHEPRQGIDVEIDEAGEIGQRDQQVRQDRERSNHRDRGGLQFQQEVDFGFRARGLAPYVMRSIDLRKRLIKRRNRGDSTRQAGLVREVESVGIFRQPQLIARQHGAWLHDAAGDHFQLDGTNIRRVIHGLVVVLRGRHAQRSL